MINYEGIPKPDFDFDAADLHVINKDFMERFGSDIFRPHESGSGLLCNLDSPIVEAGEFILDEGLFEGNEDIVEVIGSRILTIRSRAFKNCTNLISASFHDAHTIAPDAFEGCTNLTYLDVPSSQIRAEDLAINCKNSQLSTENSDSDSPTENS